MTAGSTRSVGTWALCAAPTAPRPGGGTAATSAAARMFRGYGAVLLFVLAWELLSRAGVVDLSVIPPFTLVVVTLVDGLVGGALLDDIAISLQRAGIAFAAAVALGIPLGLFMGRFRRSSARSTRSSSSSGRPRRWRSTRSSSC